MARQRGLAAWAILSLTLLAAGCGTNPIVGVLLPTSGEANTYGESIESGIRLALAECRETDRLPKGFEVVWADTQSIPGRAVSELEKMAKERSVHFVIGGVTSAEARALIPRLEDLNVLCLSPSASTPGLAQESKLFFRIYPSDELEGNTAAKFLFERFQQRKVLLYQGNEEYVAGIEPEFRRQFEELGGEIVAEIDLTEPDWQQRSAAALSSTGVEAVFIVAYAEETLAVLRHLAEQRYGGRVMATSAFYSSRVIREAGSLAEGILFPLPPFDRTSELDPVATFVNRYMNTYERPPDVFAAHGYDAMRYAIEVMRIANPPLLQEIRRAVQHGVQQFEGVTGPILFDDYGDVKHYPKMFIVKDGQVLSYQRWLKIERERIFGEVHDLLMQGGRQGGAEPTTP